MKQGGQHAQPTSYRAEIDGLRALAIVPVLFFHAGVAGFGGGYVGVDVFFVISGYLITRVIVREIDDGHFSLIGFYERRARRIMPALLVMIAAVLAVAVMLYFPADLAKVPGSAVAATLFYSNIALFFDVNYFGGGSETKPLLHSWSLAVEEQFYIGFPVLLMLIARFAPAQRRLVVAGLTAVSLAIAVATQGRGDGFAFYWLPPRAWELLAGSLVALGVFPRLGSGYRELLAAAGAGAIVLPVALYDKTTLFPGWAALPPVLGAAAIIAAGSRTSVARALSTALPVGIGLISYSLYLWHWPVVVFAQYAGDARLTGASSVAVIALSTGLAVVSWRWIERPFRQAGQFDRRAIFVGTGTGMAAICTVALALMTSNGWPARFDAQTLQRLAGADDISPVRAACHDASPDHGRPLCTLGDAARADAVLWGDSHGVEYAYAIATMPARRGRGLVQITRSSCPPVVGFSVAQAGCAAANRATMAQIIADRRLRTVYLAAFWLAAAETQPPAFWQALDRTIAALVGAGKHVVIIGAVPSYPFDIPRKLAHGRPVTGMSRADLAVRSAPLLALVNRWQRRGVILVNPADSLCPRTTCDVVRGTAPLYFDAHHPSLTAARLVASRIPPAILTAD